MLVRLAACGVCHTDLYTASGADPSGYAPTVLGHEGAGVVEEVGEGVMSLAPGDHVVTLFSPQCRECVHCVSDKTTICLAIRDQQNKGYLPMAARACTATARTSRPLHGHEHVRRGHRDARDRAREGRSEAPLDVVCTLACGATTGIGAALYIAKVEAGSTCAVFGAGLVGLGAVAGARLAGAERIIAIDLSEERLEHARRQGATDTLVGGPDSVDQILEMTDGFGADYTFEATGLVSVMRQAVESARMGWGLCTIAGVAGKGEVLEVVPRFLITGRRIAGASLAAPKAATASRARGQLHVGRPRPRVSGHPPGGARRGERRLRAMERQDGIRTVITLSSLCCSSRRGPRGPAVTTMPAPPPTPCRSRSAGPTSPGRTAGARVGQSFTLLGIVYGGTGPTSVQLYEVRTHTTPGGPSTPRERARFRVPHPAGRNTRYQLRVEGRHRIRSKVQSIYVDLKGKLTAALPRPGVAELTYTGSGGGAVNPARFGEWDREPRGSRRTARSS